MQKVYAIDWEEGNNFDKEIYLKVNNTKNPCKLLGSIKGIQLENTGNAGSVYIYNLDITMPNNYHYNAKVKGITNYGDMHTVGEIPGLYVTINGENYIPQIGDYVEAKINPENHYIIELLPTEGKSVDDMLEDMNSKDLPYCKMIQEGQINTTQSTNDNYQGYGHVHFIGIYILIGVVLGFFLTLLHKKIKIPKKQD